MNNYLNVWNLFSRSFLLDDFVREQKYLIISQKNDIAKYEKIFLEKTNKITQITDLSQIVSFVKNNDKSYFFDVELFNYNLPNLYEINNKYSIKLKKWDFLDIEEFFKKLNDFGYTYKDYLFENNFKKTWDIIEIISNLVNIKISLWWDVIEEILVDEKVKNEYFIWKILDIKNMWDSIFDNKKIEFLECQKIILDNIDTLEIYEFLQKVENISFDILKKNINQIDLKISDFFLRDLDEFLHILKSNKNISIYTKNDKTISNFLEYNNVENVKTYKTYLNFLKSFKKEDNIVICDDNISRIFVKKRSKKTISSDLDLILQIKPWDFIVHIDHGIWIFHQIIEKQVWNIKKEYLEIDYDKWDKLFVPITEINRVSKYIWSENPKITNLAWKTWSEKLAKTWKEIEVIALELLEIFAKRQLEVWYNFTIFQDELIKFRTSFEYEYTPDQENSINEIIKDMSNIRPMERLLVWDVWFGKTEVAFNAIYNAYLNKKQSILISPLVVLSYEHYEKALERFRNFGLKIWVLTRFETASQAKKIISDLGDGNLDLIIWTHRLLWDDIHFKDLWLLIIDEEHKFWVKEKEKIKSFKSHIDILSLSATPIPRSLNMALNGIRDISILSHPPLQRKWVETYVSKFDDNIIIQAWNREFASWWQLFFIHNRVSNIENMKEYLQSLWIDKKIITVHWQLPWNELEDRIIEFKQKKYDILLSTTVIENGIDFAWVNTIIINDAYKFWLSQIHQLRWRVWRRDSLWYCYLLYKKDVLSPDGAKRLSTMVEYSHLWAWFELAIKDLEIRWWGDILWINQSWMATQVWINVFLKMLEEKIEDLKLEKNMLSDEDKKHKRINIKIDLNIEAYLDNTFFTSEIDKLNFYKELEYIDNLPDLQNIIDDFLELNIATKNALNLFKLLKSRIVLNDYKILSIKRSWVSYEIFFESNIKVEDLKKFLDKDKNVFFVVSSLDKLKVPCNKFKNDTQFLEYLYNSYVEEIREKNIVKKIKLKK